MSNPQDILKSLYNTPSLVEYKNRMMKTAQDARYHAEGDVWTHTMLVMDEASKYLNTLIWELDMIGALDTKSIIKNNSDFINLIAPAVAYHDIAKPECTIEDDDGSIISPYHAKLGAQYAMRYLMEEGKPIGDIITVYNLIKYHDRPLWLGERNMELELLRLNQEVSLPLLYHVVHADIEGRICHDQDDLRLKLEVFKEEAMKLGIWNTEYKFISEHTKYMFFNSNHVPFDYERYDDTSFEVIMMCGLPGSGKDTWISQNTTLPVISLDRIRKENSWECKKDWSKAYSLAKTTAQEMCRKKKSFVWNATNLRSQLRKGLIDMFTLYGAKVKIVWVAKPLKTILTQNKKRDEVIPEDDLLNMLHGFELPSKTECHSLKIVTD